MPDLPSGTVTLFFTDVEGSTLLLRELGDAYGPALAEHGRVLRSSFAAHGGYEVDTQGDSFFAVFERAADAVAAVGEMREGLAAGPIRIRTALHTGEPQLTDGRYIGLDVVRATRICEAGHGGQILLSGTTRALVDAEVRDLGEHRLKDLPRAERIYQLGHDDFPPLRSLNQTNVSLHSTRLVGRQDELQEARSLLLEEGVRLLTLTGAPGAGKTRLGVQLAADLADRFPGGAFVVGLAPLDDASLVEDTIAQTVGAEDRLVEHLRDRRALLVLDNFEHVPAAVHIVANLLRGAPDVSIVVTSRASLRLTGERELSVPPLPQDDAVALFVDRARSVGRRVAPDDVVRSICQRLDCLPLAIELAAARSKVLSPQALLDRIDRRLPLLTAGPRDAPAHQRTLRATLEWSYDLLDERERAIFARLGVFAGGWTLDAAEAVCEATLDDLAALVDNNLVVLDEERFSLFETIREFALERLEESGEAERLRRHHADHFLARAEQVDRESRAAYVTRDWPDWMDRELGNLRAALACLHGAEDPVRALRLAGAMTSFWALRGHLAEGRGHLEHALARGSSSDAASRAFALVSLSRIELLQGDFEAARHSAQQALELYGTLGDRVGQSWGLLNLADALTELGDRTAARSSYAAAEPLVRELGELGPLVAYLTNRGNLSLAEGEYGVGVELFEEVLKLRRRHGWPEGSVVLANLGLAMLLLDRPEDALALHRRGLRQAWTRGQPREVAYGLEGVAASLASTGRGLPLAARLIGTARALREGIGAPLTAELETRVQEHSLETLRSELGSDGLDSALEHGAGIRVDAAVALALADVD